MSLISYERRKRLLDIGASAVALAGLSIPLAAIAIAIRATSPGPAIHWSRRIGRNNREFKMPKFRTMRIDTPQLATHLLSDPERYVTALGRFLRRSSVDELPQLFSILVGDMSFVGPRPALYNQDDLIRLRTEMGVDRLAPGLTGWAQVNGRDDLPISTKVRFDAEYLQRRSIRFDLKIIALTAFDALAAAGVHH